MTADCFDCKRTFPQGALVVHPFGLLCPACAEAERFNAHLRVGDTVLCRGIGAGEQRQVIVRTITITNGVWPDDGEDVQRVKWINCMARDVAVTFTDGRWAWGYQLTPYISPEESARRAKAHVATEIEETFTEGGVRRRPARINPHD